MVLLTTFNYFFIVLPIILIYKLYICDSMAAAKRGSKVKNSVIKEMKQTDVVDMYANGLTQAEIKEEFKKQGKQISLGTISNYISEARQEWTEKRMDDMDIILAKELSKLDKMEEEADAIFKKFNPDETDMESTFECSKEANEWTKTKLRIMEQRHKLLGLYKPVKLDVESKNVNVNANVDAAKETRSVILSRLSKKPE